MSVDHPAVSGDERAQDFGGAADELLALAVPTRAGRFLVPLPAEPAQLPAAPSSRLVVHVAFAEDAFRVADREVSPALLAQVVGRFAEWRRRPVVLAITADTDFWPGVPARCAELAQELGVPVSSASGPRWVGTNSAAATAVLPPWEPDQNEPAASPELSEHPQPLRASAALPCPAPVIAPLPATVPHVRVPPARDLRAVEPLVVEPYVKASDDAPTPDRSRPAAPTLPNSPSDHLWRHVTGEIRPGDREELRRALGARYETHTRAVVGLLALKPALRRSGSITDVVTGLTAVRAQQFGDLHEGLEPIEPIEPIDQAPAGPRVAKPPQVAREDARDLTNRCVQAGLAHLRVVIGPLFIAGELRSRDVQRYEPGLELVEPEFLTASLTPEHDGAGAGLAFAVWSWTGRRVDQLTGRSAAVFQAGTGFVVVGVHGRTVLLSECPAGQPAGEVVRRTEPRLLGHPLIARREPSPASAGTAPPRLIGFRPDGGRYAITPEMRDLS